jgi:hypothetical protein
MSSYFSKLSALLLITVFALSACTKSPELSGNSDAIESESYTARSGGASLIQNAQGRNIQDAWIVVFQDDVQNVEGEVEQLTRGLGGAKADHIYKHTIKGFSIKVPEVAIRGLLNNPKVKYIEQDQIVTSDATQTGATWGIDRMPIFSIPVSGPITLNSSVEEEAVMMHLVVLQMMVMDMVPTWRELLVVPSTASQKELAW